MNIQLVKVTTPKGIYYQVTKLGVVVFVSNQYSDALEMYNKIGEGYSEIITRK